MGRRYGRNQKRRHREEIARLKVFEKENEGLVNNHRLMREQLRDVFKTIESVCEYSVALPPKELRGDRYTNTVRLDIKPNIDLRSVRLNEMIYETVALTMVDTYALEVYLEEHKSEMTQVVHLLHKTPNHTAYMLSEEALLQIPEPFLVARVIPQIARELVRLMKKDYKRG